MSQNKQSGRDRKRERQRQRQIPPFLCLFTLPMPSVGSKMLIHIEEGNQLSYSTDLNAHIIWKYPHRTLPEMMFSQIPGHLWSSQVDT